MAKGDGFAVCTMKKQTGAAGGLSAHIDREIWDEENQCMVPFRPASVRNDARTALNRECIESAQKIGRTQAIWKRLNEAGFSRKKDDKTEDGKKTRKIKQDAVIALCFVCTSDEETMKKLEAEGKLDEWIEATLEWFYKEFGKENVVSAVLHMDETTPHLHVTVVPITTEEAKVRKEKPKFDEKGNPIRKYETDKDGHIILDEKGHATPVKRSYKKKEVTARLSAKDVANPFSMNRWQEDYPKAVEKFGLKRGVKGSPQKNVAPAEYNLEQIKKQAAEAQQQLDTINSEKDAAVTARDEALKERDAAVQDTKDIIKEETEKREQLSREVNQLQQTFETKSGELANVETAIEEQSSVLQNMREEEGKLDDAIAEKKQEQERMSKETWLDTMKGLVNKSDKDKKYLAEIARLEKENLAVDEKGKPVLYKSGNQASWPRYAELLRSLIQKEKEKGKEAVSTAVSEERTKSQAQVKKLNEKISSLQGELEERQKLIDKLKREKEALLQRIKSIKEGILNYFGPKFRAAVNSIVDRFNSNQSWFTHSQKDVIETSMAVEDTIKARKELGKDAVYIARVITEARGEWERIPAEVDQIAEKKWGENRAKLDAAADAVIRLSSTSGMRNFDQAGKAAIDEYLEIDGASVDDIWDEAASETGYWADYAKRALYNYANGESVKTGFKLK
jgi:hypothetical protein